MSKIEWTNKTWNPIIGCDKISEGCKNCYAEKMAKRLSGIKATSYYREVLVSYPMDDRYGKWNGKTHFIESALEKPLKRKKPTKYFICSMGDLFHESVPFEWINKVFEVVENAKQHTFQILTKRPDIMYKYMQRYGVGEMPDNIWLGVTAENQEQANKRIPILLKIHAKIRFVSVEPMLSNVDLSLWFISGYTEPPYNDVIDWVICGGETGHKAKPMHPNWVRSLRYQCKNADVPFFFKQWGGQIKKL
jgi:protein gp37